MHPSGVAKSSISLGWGKGGKLGKVTAAGWQVTLCNPIWHVISCSGAWCSDFDYELTFYSSTLPLSYFIDFDIHRIQQCLKNSFRHISLTNYLLVILAAVVITESSQAVTSRFSSSLSEFRCRQSLPGPVCSYVFSSYQVVEKSLCRIV